MIFTIIASFKKKKIEMCANDFYLCCQLHQCCVMFYLASECVVKSNSDLSRFMLIHMHFTMCCQLRQQFIIHVYIKKLRNQVKS